MYKSAVLNDVQGCLLATLRPVSRRISYHAVPDDPVPCHGVSCDTMAYIPCRTLLWASFCFGIMRVFSLRAQFGHN